MPTVNRGYVPDLSFRPRALTAARLGEGRMWKGFWSKLTDLSVRPVFTAGNYCLK